MAFVGSESGVAAPDVGVADGFVYRGKAKPKLNGKYTFGDLVDGRISGTGGKRCCWQVETLAALRGW